MVMKMSIKYGKKFVKSNCTFRTKNFVKMIHAISRESNAQTVEIKKITLTEKEFRQINYLLISLVNMLHSRNFC